jgi:membrane protein required for beta-lactamase induction
MCFDSVIFRFKTGFFTQTRWLLWRSSIDTFRNPFEFRLRFALSIVIGVLFGLLFLRLHYNQQAFQNLSAVIFLLIVNISFSNVQKNADVCLHTNYFHSLSSKLISF